LVSLRRNAVASVLSRVVTAVLWVAVTPFILRRLQAERFGIWALFFAFLSYALAFDLGLQSTMMRFIASARGSGGSIGLRRTVGRGVALALGLGAFWALVLVLARAWIVHWFHVPAGLMPETLDALGIFAGAVLLVFPAQSMMGSLQGFERIDLSTACLISGVAAQIACLCGGLAAGGGLRVAALAAVVGQAVAAGMAAWMLFIELRAVAPREGPIPHWRELINFGAALQLSGILFVLQFQSGKVLLGLLGNLAMVSDYELAFRVGSAVGGLPSLLIASVIPTVSRALQTDGREAVTSLFASASRWTYTAAVINLGLLGLLSADITRVWLGAGHDVVAHLIRVWAIGYFIVLAWGPGTVVARGMGIPWPETVGMAVSLAANVLLAVWWIPRWGAAGAVAALCASFIPAFAVFVALFHKRSGIPFWSWLVREFMPRTVAGIVTVTVCVLLLIAGERAGVLPGAGLLHAGLATVLFTVVFALVFMPLGDTQRLAGVLRHATLSFWTWARRVPAS
jgi:O-antigen/teichoic acid export membrane protein